MNEWNNKLVNPDETVDTKKFIFEMSDLIYKYGEFVSVPILGATTIELGRSVIASVYGEEKAKQVMIKAVEEPLIQILMPEKDV